LVSVASNESSPITASKKKLYALNPANPPQFVQTQRTRKKQRSVPADPKSLERQVRQTLADKISGNQIGIWLLLPEHLRLGTWDLMRSWSGLPTDRVEPRLALHLVNEAAMCLCSYRQRRTLSQKGFELANGLPFVPTDLAIHNLLQSHTVQQAQQLQIALGKLRRAGGHFEGTLLALDPHRMTSYSQRQMRRHRFSSEAKPAKMAQTFFLLDCHTRSARLFQPQFFGAIRGASQPRTVARGRRNFGGGASGNRQAIDSCRQGTLLPGTLLHHASGKGLRLALRTAGLLPFDQALEPSSRRSIYRALARLRDRPPALPFQGRARGLYHEYVQRSGLRQQDYHYQGS